MFFLARHELWKVDVKHLLIVCTDDVDRYDSEITFVNESGNKKDTRTTAS